MQLLASSGDIYNSTVLSWENEQSEYELGRVLHSEFSSSLGAMGPNHFKSCTWTPDGTSLVSTNSDYALRLIIAPPSLLEGGILLRPFTRRFMPCPIVSAAVSPHFDLQRPDLCVVAVSHRGSPVKLYNVLSNDSGAALTLPLEHNGEILPAYDMEFSNHSLVCGTKRKVVVFDVGVGDTKAVSILRGIASTVRSNARGEVVAGTFDGLVTLYDSSLRAIVSRSVGSPVKDLVWCPNGNHVYVTTTGEIFVLDRRCNLEVLRSVKLERKVNHRVHGCMLGEQFLYGSGSSVVVESDDGERGVQEMSLEQHGSITADVSSISKHPTNDSLLAVSFGNYQKSGVSICSLDCRH